MTGLMVRAAAVLSVLLTAGGTVAGTLTAVAPLAPILALTGMALVFSVMAAAAPSWPWATLTLIALAGAYVAAADGVGLGVAIGWAVGEAAALWVVHSLYASAAAIPLHTRADQVVVQVYLRRLRTTLGIALPAVAATVLAGGSMHEDASLRAVGAAAAVLIVLAPVLWLRRH